MEKAFEIFIDNSTVILRSSEELEEAAWRRDTYIDNMNLAFSRYLDLRRYHKAICEDRQAHDEMPEDYHNGVPTWETDEMLVMEKEVRIEYEANLDRVLQQEDEFDALAEEIEFFKDMQHLAATSKVFAILVNR